MQWWIGINQAHEWVQALADVLRSSCVVIATKPVHKLQICPTVHNLGHPLPLHAGPCSSVARDRQIHRWMWPLHISPWLCLMQNVMNDLSNWLDHRCRMMEVDRIIKKRCSRKTRFDDIKGCEEFWSVVRGISMTVLLCLSSQNERKISGATTSWPGFTWEMVVSLVCLSWRTRVHACTCVWLM